jgi:AhpD family alkylhydroperoxidase
MSTIVCPTPKPTRASRPSSTTSAPPGGSDFVNNPWHYLAFAPALLESVWRDVKAVMARPSTLDLLTKKMIYAAVSIANSCPYCLHSHTASARRHGMTDAQHAAFLQIVSLAARTNHLVNGMQIPIEDVFDKELST